MFSLIIVIVIYISTIFLDKHIHPVIVNFSIINLNQLLQTADTELTSDIDENDLRQSINYSMEELNKQLDVIIKEQPTGNINIILYLPI